MKKNLLLATTLIASTLLLAGCDSGSKGGIDPAPNPNPSPENVPGSSGF